MSYYYSDKLIKKIADINENHNNIQEAKKKGVRQIEAREKLDKFLDTLQTTLKNTKSSISELIKTVKRNIDTKNQARYDQKQFNLDCIEEFEAFLEFADMCEGCFGVEIEPENPEDKLIHTELGPIAVSPISAPKGLTSKDKCFLFEGIAPDGDGLLKYLNLEVTAIAPRKSNSETDAELANGIVITQGYSVDPVTFDVRAINESNPYQNNKLLFYLKKQEELASTSDTLEIQQ